MLFATAFAMLMLEKDKYINEPDLLYGELLEPLITDDELRELEKYEDH